MWEPRRPRPEFVWRSWVVGQWGLEDLGKSVSRPNFELGQSGFDFDPDWPILSKCWPEASEFWGDLDRFDDVPKFGKRSTSVGKFGPESMKFAPIATNVWPNSADYDQVRPTIAPTR